ncbi:MAG: DEAD/DEAH box helicase [Candidatus Altimarinota bacterium]
MLQSLAGNLQLEPENGSQRIWQFLHQYLSQLGSNGILGYKIPSLGNEQEWVPSIIFRSKEHGIILIEIAKDKLESVNDSDYWFYKTGHTHTRNKDNVLDTFKGEVENRLRKSNQLYDRKNKMFLVEIKTILILPFNDKVDEKSLLTELYPDWLCDKVLYSDNYEDELKSLLGEKDLNYGEDQLSMIDALLEGTESFISKNDFIPNDPKTKNDFIKESLNETFRLDQTQRSLAMQIPSGPQRIRGLAGTGKTVILCMKTALVHKDHKDFKVLFLFNTQSMYGQIRDKITKYYLNEKKSIPDWNNVHILHAWGGRSREGLYYRLCNELNIKPKTLLDIPRGFDGTEVIYKDILKYKDQLKQEYDMVLIDEAQDFPQEVFETLFYITKGDPGKKKIIWAYDEFQTLKDIKIKQPEQLFGRDNDGNPNMPNNILDGQYLGGIKKDFVLPNSYRNPRLTLMVAHGIGMGLYSEKDIIPMEDRESWIARGYTVIEPAQKNNFSANDQVVVEREDTYSKNILERLLSEKGNHNDTLIQFHDADNLISELTYVSSEIKKLITEDGVPPEEIIVITLRTSTSKKDLEMLRSLLNQNGISAITPGYVESSNMFKEPGSVTLVTPFRAKGNEANIVFVINSQQVIANATYVARGSFFVSVTRSRGWCYISGNGDFIDKLGLEINKIISDYPKFKFSFPNPESLQRRLNLINNSDKAEKVDEQIDLLFSDEVSKSVLMERLLKDEAFKKVYNEYQAKNSNDV